MFRKIIFTVLMVLFMVSSAAAENWQWEQVMLARPETGRVVVIDFMLADGPATDCDRVVISNQAALFLSSNGVTPQLVRNFRNQLEERLSTKVTVSKVVIANLFELENAVSFNTLGL